jgi:hypothetical protein
MYDKQIRFHISFDGLNSCEIWIGGLLHDAGWSDEHLLRVFINFFRHQLQDAAGTVILQYVMANVRFHGKLTLSLVSTSFITMC